jgi:adenosylhomocysteine nucleosidase
MRRPPAAAGRDAPAASHPRGGADAEAATVAAAPSAPTAIIAPLAAELASVLAATAARRTVRVGAPPPGWPRWTVTLGRLAGEEVALMATGDGPAAAAAGLAALLAAVRPRRLLVIGVAGGLTPGLAEGTLVAARRVVAGDGSAMPRDPDAAWLAAALAGGAVGGVIVAADRIVADPAARQAVLQEALPAAALAGMPAGMPAAIATVDLESAAYARVAAAWSLPYLVVRAVLDPAGEELPLDFEACRDGSGRVSNRRVLWRALGRPRSLGKLWRLRARVRRAAASLAAFAERLLAAPADGIAAWQADTLQAARPAGDTGESEDVESRHGSSGSGSVGSASLWAKAVGTGAAADFDASPKGTRSQRTHYRTAVAGRRRA